MAKKNLSFFMRSTEPEIVHMAGPDSIKDPETGKPVEFEIRVVPQAEIQKINRMYTQRTVALDNKGRPMVANGEVVWKRERDSDRAFRHLIAEALVYPDLKDKELMDYYKCSDISEMPLKVFPKADEYQRVSRMVMIACGLSDDTLDGSGDQEIINEAKN